MKKVKAKVVDNLFSFNEKTELKRELFYIFQMFTLFNVN